MVFVALVSVVSLWSDLLVVVRAALWSDYMFMSMMCLSSIPWHLILAMLRTLFRFVIRPNVPWDLCLRYRLLRAL